jgi:hypothetical protein
MRALLFLAAWACTVPTRAADTPEVAVAALEKLGAKIDRTTKLQPAGKVFQVTFPRKGCEITDEDLKHVAVLTDVEWVLILGQKKVTGEGLKHLAKLPNLKHIDLSKSAIEGKHLVHLGKLKQLVRLGLWDTLIDDAGLAHLKDLKELRYLFLVNTKITDEGLKNLGEKPKVYDLRLGGTLVTDAGLPVIKTQFPMVSEITAKDTKITKEGAERGKKLGITVDFTTKY